MVICSYRKGLKFFEFVQRNDYALTGATVAIQDVDQHMYFAVDGERNKYSLVGAIHYSLVGERALFKVYCFAVLIPCW